MYTPQRLWVPCGRCVQCRRRRASDWRLRLLHEFKYGNHTNAVFVTLTIDDEHYKGVYDTPINKYVRSFFENYRNVYRKRGERHGKIPKHFFITELGSKRGRLHLHGIIFDSEIFDGSHPKIVAHDRHGRPITRSMLIMRDRLRSLWPYGKEVFAGSRCDLTTASYIMKYMMKPDDNSYKFTPDGLVYYPRIFCSPGLGKCALSNSTLRDLRRAYYHRTPYIFSLEGIGKDGRVRSFRYAVPSYYGYQAVPLSERLSVRPRFQKPFQESGNTLPRRAFGREFFSDDDYLSYVKPLYNGSRYRKPEAVFVVDDYDNIGIHYNYGFEPRFHPRPRPRDLRRKVNRFDSSFMFNLII